MIVIKVGGDAVERLPLKSLSLEAGTLLLHGGGSAITKALTAEGIQTGFHETSLRSTPPEAIPIVRRTLKEITDNLTRNLSRTCAVSSLEGHQVLTAQPCLEEELGRVGHVTRVDVAKISSLLTRSVVVMNSLAQGADGLLNVNADEAAAEIAVALRADKIIWVSLTPVRESVLKTAAIQRCTQVGIPSVTKCLGT